jgi:3-methyladenine DNA glycosylase AlkC
VTPAGESGPKDFKDRISPEAVSGLASILSDAWPGFPEEEFAASATSGLTDLEMKARVNQVARALNATMPGDFDSAAGVVRKAMEAPDFDGWIVYCVNDWVALAGIDRPDTALPLLGELTSRWSAEFAIRPFIEAHQERTFEQFRLWTASSDEHRRRLVSEGSRPRLPWGRQLTVFVADPTPAIALLDRLVDDPSAYVRKSVANHLNDIGKDHPGLALETAARWLGETASSADAAAVVDAAGSRGETGERRGPDRERRQWVVSHGLRSLVKAGDPEALRLLGFDPDAPVSLADFAVTPKRIAIGEAVTIEFSLRAADSTAVMVDYLVHHAGVRRDSGNPGSRRRRKPKVFKLKRTVLEADVGTFFRKRHRFRDASVRRIHPGPHLVEIQVNGRVLATATVEVTGP